MDYLAVIVFLGIVLLSAAAGALKKAGRGGEEQRRTQYPGPVARPPLGPGWDRRPAPRVPQAPRSESPGVPWQSAEQPKTQAPPTFRPNERSVTQPMSTKRPQLGELQQQNPDYGSEELVDREVAAMEAETDRMLGQANQMGLDAERMGREAEQRSQASSLRAEADSLGDLRGTQVAARANTQPLPASPAAVVSWLRAENLGHAVVLAEVLGPPKSMARRAVSAVRHHQLVRPAGVQPKG